MTESYQFVLKMLRKRLPPVLSDGAELNTLSVAELLNLLFALYGAWGTVGDFCATFKILMKLLGERQLWEEPTTIQSVSDRLQ